MAFLCVVRARAFFKRGEFLRRLLLNMMSHSLSWYFTLFLASLSTSSNSARDMLEKSDDRFILTDPSITNDSKMAIIWSFRSNAYATISLINGLTSLSTGVVNPWILIPTSFASCHTGKPRERGIHSSTLLSNVFISCLFIIMPSGMEWLPGS